MTTPDQQPPRRPGDPDRLHRREYEEALAISGVEGPAWDDLPEEKKEAIRRTNHEYWRELHEFGKSLALGPK